jgi:hypothetical protein
MERMLGSLRCSENRGRKKEKKEREKAEELPWIWLEKLDLPAGDARALAEEEAEAEPFFTSGF